MLDWEAILSKLRDEVSDDVFLFCLAVLQARDDGKTLVLLAPNPYIREEVVKTHLERILELRDGPVEVRVGGLPKAEAKGPQRTGALHDASSVPASKLNSAKTFANFMPAACNRAALQSAQAMADGGDCEPGVLVLHGPVGVGKSHLLLAVGNRVSQTHPDWTVVYWRAHSFITYLSAAFRKSAAEGGAAVERLQRSLRSIDVLLFDDVHLIVQGPPKPRMQEELRRLIDAALDQGPRVMLASKWHPNQFPRNADEDLRARLASCLNVRLDLPGPAASLRILDQMAKDQMAKCRWSGLPLEACVLGEVASLCGREHDCRQLEGALRTVFAAAKAKKGRRKVTKKLVREILRPPVAALRPISLEDVQAEVVDYYQVSVADMRSKRRMKTLVRIRHIGMHLARKLTNCSYFEIGKAWGNRHHTTVKSACDRICRLIKTDGSAANECRELTARIKARANKPPPPDKPQSPDKPQPADKLQSPDKPPPPDKPQSPNKPQPPLDSAAKRPPAPVAPAPRSGRRPGRAPHPAPQ